MKTEGVTEIQDVQEKKNWISENFRVSANVLIEIKT